MIGNMATALVKHGRIRTTLSKAKAMQRVADRLVTLGKDGSVHSRRMAYRILKDRDIVKHLFGEIAPRFLDVHGGYTRVLKLDNRRGDAAPCALLEFTRLPAVAAPKSPEKTKAKPAPKGTAEGPAEGGKAAEAKAPKAEEGAKPKKFLEGLRSIFKRKQGDTGAK
jgi:large subunit ribosomal protein L17